MHRAFTEGGGGGAKVAPAGRSVGVAVGSAVGGADVDSTVPGTRVFGTGANEVSAGRSVAGSCVEGSYVGAIVGSTVGDADVGGAAVPGWSVAGSCVEGRSVGVVVEGNLSHVNTPSFSARVAVLSHCTAKQTPWCCTV